MYSDIQNTGNILSQGYPSSIKNICARARCMIDDNAPLHEILTCLVTAAETICEPATVASILLLDDEGLLRNGASPNLPRDYLNAIDRLKPAPNLGTCAAAAAIGEIVITPSFLADEKWAELRHLPLALGFAGAWSMPIKSAENGRVLGTFGTYFREVREPSEMELAAVGALAEVAALAVDRTAKK